MLWKRRYSQTKSRLLLLILQLIVLSACVYYLIFHYQFRLYPDQEAKAVYQPVECFIISKRLSSKGIILHAYRAEFLITYTVNGVQYNRWVYGNGLDDGFVRNESQQEDILSQFKVGGAYTCWYHPGHPQEVMLVKRHNWQTVYILILPAILSIFTFYYLLKNVLYFSTLKKRKKKEK